MQPYASSEQFRLAPTQVDSVALTPSSRDGSSVDVPQTQNGTDVPRQDSLRQKFRFEHVQKVDPLALSSVMEGRRSYFLAKRLLDIAVTLTAMIVLLPVMAMIALLIAWDSPGPIVFKQTRVGAKPVRDGQRMYWRRHDFTFYKFRSMKHNSDVNLHKEFVQAYIAGDDNKMREIQPDKDGADMYKLNGDPRVTRVGAFLRKTSLDELPQLWNVLKGDMSLVGPRPPIPYEVEMYSAHSLRRLTTMPGMTGLWQVRGRGELGFEAQVALDIEYIENQSLWYDVKIILGTIPAVFLSRGAK